MSENNLAISPETMAQIDAICQNENSPSESEYVKRLLLEIIQANFMIIGLDYHDIYAQFSQGGKVSALEIEVDATCPDRMQQIASKIGEHCRLMPCLSNIMLYFDCRKDSLLKMDELNSLNDMFQTIGDSINIKWGVNVNKAQTDIPKIRVIVLTQ